MNNFLLGVIGVVLGILFVVALVVVFHLIGPWISFQIQVLEHGWRHRYLKRRLKK